MRLISLCPSLTELLFDLGAGPEVVGRTKFCVHPADGVAHVETVGGTKNPKIERIVALAPDLVFMNEEENRIEDANALRAAGIRVHSSLPRTVAESTSMVWSIAGAIGRSEAGEGIVREIERAEHEVMQAAVGQPPVRFAYLIWREPLMTLNNDTFVSALLGIAGGVNAFGTAAERYPTIDAAALNGANPDAVLLSSEPFPFADKHADELAALSRLPRDRFHLVDGELLSWHGSRTIRGIRYAGEIIRAFRAGSRTQTAPQGRS